MFWGQGRQNPQAMFVPALTSPGLWKLTTTESPFNLGKYSLSTYPPAYCC